MKKKLLLNMLLCLITLSTFAQEYRPMLTDGKEWHCFRRVALSDVDWEPNGEWTYTIKVVGDSVINPNRSLENDKKLFLMTAIRKTALYMLDS